MDDDQIKHMVSRFLAWKLPDGFSPDGGVSFKRDFNENTPHPMKHEPVGTNLLSAAQAEAMVRHMLEGIPTPLQKLADQINTLKPSPVSSEEYASGYADGRYDAWLTVQEAADNAV